MTAIMAGYNGTNLTEKDYMRFLNNLLLAKEAFKSEWVFYDLGAGERPQKALARFRMVAAKEGIPVQISKSKNGKSLMFFFPPEKPQEPKFRVRRQDGKLKAFSISGGENKK